MPHSTEPPSSSLAHPLSRHGARTRDRRGETEGLTLRLLSRLKFRDITLLITIYELLSIRAASRRCNISQATGSRRLQKVEAALGLILFIRQPTLLKPTPEGEVVYQACLQWKAATQSLANQLQQMQQGL